MLSEKTQTEAAGEPDTLFAGLEPAAGLALAVSGGPDSMALLALFAQWRRGTGDTRPAVVLTVDHGLRPESAEECAYVAEVARHFGLEPRVLRWRPAAGTAISQTSARDGRFRLIFQAMRRLDLSHLLLAHHRDDQAETVVMRFLNGSGIDGMAGMARMSDRGGVTLVRPLLAYS
ncbi:MAG: tRNA lysidine(34) synthetase TilS, partial [Rhodobiaceae bacterium]|nr:tRNA lysidine(34) synthetase TilS [Rhodobiaceae bacterium]